MGMKVSEVAKQIGGVLEGPGEAEIVGLAGLREAGPGQVTFLSNSRYALLMSTTQASAVVVGADWKGDCPCPVIRVKDPDVAFSAIAAWLGPQPVTPLPGIHPTAVVAEDVEIGPDVSIGPCCVLEKGVRVGARSILYAGCYLGCHSRIGADCLFYPHVSLREHTIVGDRVIIHNGAVIGSDGFGYSRDGARWKKIPQIGNVEIGDDVEIGANVAIDRARFGKTVVGNGTKIDNLVQIAHNVTIGENTAMAAQVGIAGSSSIGKGVQLAGQSGVAGHLSVGDGVVVFGKAGVTKDIPSGAFVSGFPAIPHKEAQKMQAHMARIPQMKAHIQALEKRIQELEEKIEKQ